MMQKFSFFLILKETHSLKPVPDSWGERRSVLGLGSRGCTFWKMFPVVLITSLPCRGSGKFLKHRRSIKSKMWYILETLFLWFLYKWSWDSHMLLMKIYGVFPWTKRIKLFLYFRMNGLRVWKFFLHIVRVQQICVDLNWGISRGFSSHLGDLGGHYAKWNKSEKDKY